MKEIASGYGAAVCLGDRVESSSGSGRFLKLSFPLSYTLSVSGAAALVVVSVVAWSTALSRTCGRAVISAWRDSVSLGLGASAIVAPKVRLG